MGKDGSWGEFLYPSHRYADSVNGLVFHGEQYLKPDDLHEVDTQERGIRLPKFVKRFTNEKAWKKTKYRDLIRKAAFGMHYVIIGIENQEVVDYSIPLRNMIYDVSEYEKQAAHIRKIVRKQKKHLSAGEYLYGFTKESRLSPVTTLILYAGKESWKGPTCLHDMLELTDIPKELIKIIPDYKINVINLCEIEDTSIFKTDLKHVIDFIKCTADPEAMEHLVRSDVYYQHVEEDAYDVMASYVNMERMDVVKEEYRQEGTVNMCEGIRGWIDKEVAIGREEGRAEGIIQMARSYCVPEAEIMKQLVELLHIDEENAKEYLHKKYVA